MRSESMYIILFLLSVFMSSVSQIILKKRATTKCDSLIKEYLNWPVAISYLIFFGSSLITVLAYKEVPLSMGPILEATGYIWVSVLGFFILKEKTNKRKMLGLCIVVLGIIIFNL